MSSLHLLPRNINAQIENLTALYLNIWDIQWLLTSHEADIQENKQANMRIPSLLRESIF